VGGCASDAASDVTVHPIRKKNNSTPTHSLFSTKHSININTTFHREILQNEKGKQIVQSKKVLEKIDALDAQIEKLKFETKQHDNATAKYIKDYEQEHKLIDQEHKLKALLESMNAIATLAEGESPDEVRSQLEDVTAKRKDSVKKQKETKSQLFDLSKKLDIFVKLGATHENNIEKEKKIEKIENEISKRKEYRDFIQMERDQMIRDLEQEEESDENK
jgi:hypothetical protein